MELIKKLENWTGDSRACLVVYWCFKNLNWLVDGNGHLIPFEPAGGLTMGVMPTYPAVSKNALTAWAHGLAKNLMSQIADMPASGRGYVSVDMDTSLNMALFINGLGDLLAKSATTFFDIANFMESVLDFQNVNAGAL